MADIRVLIHGVAGRMGQETLKAVCEAADTLPVGGVDLVAPGNRLHLPNGAGSIPLSSDLSTLILQTKPRVVVDFSNADATIQAAYTTIEAGVCFVTGTSGLKDEAVRLMDERAREKGVGVVVAPNFALGAVVLQSLVQKAAPYFDYVDIIESHHEGKIDAPSGTSIALARAAADGKEFVRKEPQRENLEGSMGAQVGGVGIHSLRQPGRSAHHEVVFGAQGQTLTLRHDTLGRDCYMPGVLRAIREVVNIKGLVLGLDKILGV